jgi:hypothetical protein
MSIDLDESVRELRFITRRLRLVGPLLLLVTLVNIGVMLWAIERSARSPRYVEYSELPVTLNVAITIATIATLGLFETLRKRGDAIFQELSDELQWHLGRRGFEDAPRERPLLEERITLRTFSAATELPLVPGLFGGAIYAALNLMIAVTSVLVFRA